MLKARPYAELYITVFPTISLRTYRVMLLLSLIMMLKRLQDILMTLGVKSFP